MKAKNPCKPQVRNRFFRKLAIGAVTLTVLAVASAQGALRTWTGGGSDALASTDANWDPAEAPVTGNTVRFDDTSSANCDWDLDVILADWIQTEAYTGTVTFRTRYPDQGSFTNLLIGGNAIIEGGVWTHPANSGGATETDRLSISVGGDFILGTNATINLNSRGFERREGPGAGNTSRRGGYAASHGGRGATGGSYWPPTYGSVTRPENLGSAAQGAGGGALRLDAGGTATLFGQIHAIGEGAGTQNGGAGGSVLIEAAGITGNGAIHANAGSGYYGAGGGRIALVTTVSENEPDGLTLTAFPSTSTREGGGRAGTIYLETPVSRRMIVDQNNIGSASEIHTDLPPVLAPENPHPAFESELDDVTLVAINDAFIGLSRDLRMDTIEWLDGTLSLNALTLYLKADEPSGSFPADFGSGTVEPAGTVYTFLNGDDLIRDGRLFWGDEPVTWRAVSVVDAAAGGGTTTIDGGANEGYFTPGTPLAFEALPDIGHSFAHWEGMLPDGADPFDANLALDSLDENTALRAWFRDDNADISTNIWLSWPSTDDWDDPRNWSQFMVPVDGQHIEIGADATIVLTNDTALLGSVSIDGGTLTMPSMFSEDTNRLFRVDGPVSILNQASVSLEQLQAGDVTLNNATLTLAGATAASLNADNGATLIQIHWHRPLTVAGAAYFGQETTLTVPPAFGEDEMSNRVWIVCNEFTLTETARIDAEGLGWRGGLETNEDGHGPGGSIGGYNMSSGGAWHGGAGGISVTGHGGGEIYGCPILPVAPGSGAGRTRYASQRHGGGAVRIEATGPAVIDGIITADGMSGQTGAHGRHSGAGSGGSILLAAGRLFAGENAMLSARGGDAVANGGGGGGGRIAVWLGSTRTQREFVAKNPETIALITSTTHHDFHGSLDADSVAGGEEGDPETSAEGGEPGTFAFYRIQHGTLLMVR